MKKNIAIICLIIVASFFPKLSFSQGNAENIVNTVCIACHNKDGNSVIAANPKLAGQHAKYMSKQLKEFKEGSRKNAVMAGMVANLTPDDMKNLGEYFGEQKTVIGTAKSNGAGSLGEKIYKTGIAGIGVPACASCHGPSGKGIPDQFPRLSGQHSEYVTIQLKAFRAGERANDAAKMMRTIAKRLSDEEINAVADYVQGLH